MLFWDSHLLIMRDTLWDCVGLLNLFTSGGTIQTSVYNTWSVHILDAVSAFILYISVSIQTCKTGTLYMKNKYQHKMNELTLVSNTKPHFPLHFWFLSVGQTPLTNQPPYPTILFPWAPGHTCEPFPHWGSESSNVPQASKEHKMWTA